MGIGTSLKRIGRKIDPKPLAERLNKKLEDKGSGQTPKSARESVHDLLLPDKKQLEDAPGQTKDLVKLGGNYVDNNKFAIIGAYAGGYQGAAMGAGADKRGVLTWGDEEDDEEETIAPPIALPDEELQRSARRKARGRRRGGRSSSILTGGALG